MISSYRFILTVAVVTVFAFGREQTVPQVVPMLPVCVANHVLR